MCLRLSDRRSGSARAGGLAVAAAAALAAACAGPRVPAPPAVAPPAAVRVLHTGSVRTVPLEEYVLSTVLAEVSPVGEPAPVAARIYEVQAVVARTYAASNLGRHQAQGFDLCDTTHCQVYAPERIRSSRFAQTAAAAVQRTAGQLLLFGRRPATSVFHADCGGWTAAADAVWGGPAVPYLPALKDDVPAVQHRTWTLDASIDRLRAALNADDRTQVGRRLDAIEIVSRDASGRAAGLAVRGERSFTVRGDDLRVVINRALGDRSILSTRFTIDRRGASYTFTGTGYGHGVGLCQVGAAARARRGDSLDAILSAYFPGAALGTFRVPLPVPAFLPPAEPPGSRHGR